MIFNLMKPVPVDEPTMYLYGHEAKADETPTAYIGDVGYVGAVGLPPLPEWDKDTYPYVHLWLALAPLPSSYCVEFSTTPVYAEDRPSLNNHQLLYTSKGRAIRYELYIHYENDWGHRREYSYEPATSSAECGYSVVWSNHDIYYTNGSLLISGTEPIPLGEIVAYSYNGTVLPKLPEWDKEQYPYAVIGYLGLRYRLRLLKAPYTTSSTDNLYAHFYEHHLNPTTTQYSTYRGADGNVEGWGEIVTSESELVLVGEPIWCNYDLSTYDGTLRLEASDPIPVYE